MTISNLTLTAFSHVPGHRRAQRCSAEPVLGIISLQEPEGVTATPWRLRDGCLSSSGATFQSFSFYSYGIWHIPVTSSLPVCVSPWLMQITVTICKTERRSFHFASTVAVRCVGRFLLTDNALFVCISRPFFEWIMEKLCYTADF